MIFEIPDASLISATNSPVAGGSKISLLSVPVSLSPSSLAQGTAIVGHAVDSMTSPGFLGITLRSVWPKGCWFGVVPNQPILFPANAKNWQSSSGLRGKARMRKTSPLAYRKSLGASPVHFSKRIPGLFGS
ncbi:hypothetical protein EBX93_16180 [bacterium]|nr:hypothetical protein [bacterium]